MTGWTRQFLCDSPLEARNISHANRQKSRQRVRSLARRNQGQSEISRGCSRRRRHSRPLSCEERGERFRWRPLSAPESGLGVRCRGFDSPMFRKLRPAAHREDVRSCMRRGLPCACVRGKFGRPSLPPSRAYLAPRSRWWTGSRTGRRRAGSRPRSPVASAA
jgi:hypothetical protein